MAQPVDYAWAAGIIDGEGCIRLQRNQRNSYTIIVIVNNTDLPMLRRLVEIFPVGNITSTPISREGKRTIWRWLACSKNAALILETILPYLVTKRRQAEAALLAQRLISVEKPHNAPNPHREELSRLDLELRRLKREDVPA